MSMENQPQMLVQGLSSIVPSSTSLITFLRENLKQSDIEEFNNLCTEFGVKFNSDVAIVADLINLRAVKRSSIECKNCTRTTSRVCYKYSVIVVDGRIRCKRVVCNENTAVQIINRSGEPMIFKNMRTENFKVMPSNNTAVIAAADSILQRKGLYLYGPAGTGKTLLSCIIINERAYSGQSSFFYTINSLVDKLRDFNNSLEREVHLAKVTRCRCLVIDDLGAEYVTDWVASTLFQILDERYKKNLQTIINSNLSLDDVMSRYPTVYAERIIRRIQALCTVVSVS